MPALVEYHVESLSGPVVLLVFVGCLACESGVMTKHRNSSATAVRVAVLCAVCNTRCSRHSHCTESAFCSSYDGPFTVVKTSLSYTPTALPAKPFAATSCGDWLLRGLRLRCASLAPVWKRHVGISTVYAA